MSTLDQWKRWFAENCCEWNDITDVEEKLRRIREHAINDIMDMDEFSLWTPIVFINTCIINGMKITMTMRGYDGGSVWHWIVLIDDGYLINSSMTGIDITSSEARKSAEAAAEEMMGW